ncbi:MAG: hypothetical protein JKY65_13060 [Planctomycetes bacterium]|nr:hypothetical protein [Planctomycetota bacterium]
MSELPDHYRAAIRRLLRLAAVGIMIGLLLGITWTEFNRSTRYGETIRKVDPPEGRVKIELPAGTRWASGLHFKIGHGHSILILGLLPIGFAACLLLLHRAGGRVISPRTVKLAPILYYVGGVGAVALMIYKGGAVFLGLRSSILAGTPTDLGTLEAGLFGGSRAIKGMLYGTTHTAMAVGAFWFMIGVFKSAGGIGVEPTEPVPDPAAPVAEPSPPATEA